MDDCSEGCFGRNDSKASLSNWSTRLVTSPLNINQLVVGVQLD